jgi:4'-phosphopantetheinyl transferase
MSSLLPCLAETLSASERQRADRFQFDRDRLRFIARRGLLRRILGRYVNVDPARLSFTLSSRGKPALAAKNGGPALHFNLSHSEGLALFAVAHNCPLGVDVERLRPIAEADGIAEKFFSARETFMLNSRPGTSKLEAFFRCWTAKEAFLKATGDGITDSLAEVEVSLGVGLKPELLRIAGDAQLASLWTLHTLAPAPGFVGTLAVKASGLKLACWCWPQIELKSAS